jgi:hypothetical protein
VRAMDRRITRLEQGRQSPVAPNLVLFWDDDLLPCRDHPACAIEKTSAAHFGNVVRLRFEEGR